MTNQEVKQKINDVQFKRDKFRNIAKTTEFIFIAIVLAVWLFLDPPNLIMAIIMSVGYLIINGILFVNVMPLIDKFNDLKKRI